MNPFRGIVGVAIYKTLCVSLNFINSIFDIYNVILITDIVRIEFTQI